ncbi:ATP-binding protein [Streptomyces phaeochromogenes]|uniref:ATP-binding protein n=1 Tax=Streptomyces phaeochromogenes TaxID=1923 RepID=A0ABZ1HP79_STRPH|nr:ATP-binding protein [Streptomyces phaeochromogenes]MCX5599638.1 ATP-binding protein [Streptomyces phaeochromogenes]WSD20415.1 ATP-binding protein [Streptomyces phaeochromogenes]WSJ02893.1 ATP-binding protein [Streptomyces phaeochromogenes]
MAIEPRWDDKLPSEETYTQTTEFAGEPSDVTGSRLAAEAFLLALTRASPPAEPERWDDILLVVTELAANAVQYAPGPFTLHLRRTFDGVHVTMHDTSTTPPAPRPFRPGRNDGGVGWHLIHTLCDQVSVVPTEKGKDIHVFMPW